MAASTYPIKVYEDSLSFYQRLGELVVDHTSSFLPNAVDCLSIIASSVSGKQVLQKAGIMGQILRRLGSLAKDGNSELKTTALNTIAALLGVEEGSNSEMKNLNEEICEEWFYELDAQPLEFLQKTAAKPFKDQRLAVLKIFIGMASQSWAQKMMRDHPTFCEYLLDRSTEKDVEGLELKYQIITTLTSSHTSQNIFPAPYLIKLKVYERQGPVYVQASSQVAVEEA